MNPSNAFRRAILFMQTLTAVNALPISERIAARANLGEYESNGHGRDRFTGRFDNRRMTRHQGHGRVMWAESGSGKREVERRQRQISNGLLQVSPV